MSASRPDFDHDREPELLSGYLDGELTPAEAERVERHLAACLRCRDELAQLRRLQEVTGRLRLREAPPEAWEQFWQSAYHRAERGAGWILLGLGAVVLGAYGLHQAALALWQEAQLPWLVKAAILAACAGVMLLLVSVVRERVFTRGRTRYKDVVR